MVEPFSSKTTITQVIVMDLQNVSKYNNITKSNFSWISSFKWFSTLSALHPLHKNEFKLKSWVGSMSHISTHMEPSIAIHNECQLNSFSLFFFSLSVSCRSAAAVVRFGIIFIMIFSKNGRCIGVCVYVSHTHNHNQLKRY